VPGFEEMRTQSPDTTTVAFRERGQVGVSPVAVTNDLRETLPRKPPEGVIVIDAVPPEPEIRSITGDETEIAKSPGETPKVKVPLVACDEAPSELTPATSAENVPVGAVHVNVDVPVSLGLSVISVEVSGLQARPVGNASVIDTSPAKLNVLVKLTRDVMEPPGAPLGDVALMVKSPTWAVKVVV